ncbi:MAG: hypothetical protein LBC80_10095 [Treponema sp.]|nr:hypothetical protein [Treponema sp.]
MDSLFPSIGNYKIIIQINNIPLDECSFASSGDKIRPFFEESVSNDPDVTGLEVFLRDSRGNIIEWKVIYELDPDLPQDEDIDEDKEEDLELAVDDETSETPAKKNPSETTASINSRSLHSLTEVIFWVRDLSDLPPFSLPVNLPMGRYTVVSHVMGGKNVLQRIERTIFYLSDTDFSYKGINVHLPGITDSTQLIPKGTVIMLEADLVYDSSLDPHIEWFNGRRKISEGKVSEGAGYLLWKVPEESGFFSIHAVVYPIENYQDLSGFLEEVSLLVTSRSIDIHLVSEDTPELVHWYVFEGNLNDSKTTASAEHVLKHERDSPRWMGSGGTYGIAAGFGNKVSLPGVTFSPNDNNWQVLFRLKPLNDGGIFSIQFDKANMHLYMDGSNLILTLSSPSNTVSQFYTLMVPVPVPTPGFTALWPSDEDESFPESFEQTSFDQMTFEQPEVEQTETEQTKVEYNWADKDSFFTVSINFSILPGFLSAQLNVLGDYIDSKLAATPITLEADINDEFKILLGSVQENIKPRLTEETSDQTTAIRHEITALWDEFALYIVPPMEIQSNEDEELAVESETSLLGD